MKKFSTSVEGKALAWESAETPMDSRRSIAGSSASKLLTTSIFWEESHRGISASLCVHFSGCSVFMQSSARGAGVISFRCVAIGLAVEWLTADKRN